MLRNRMRKRTGRGKWRTHVLLTRKSTLENMNILILDTPVSWKMGQYHQNWHECVTAKRRIPPCKVSNQPNLSKRVRDKGKAKVFVVVAAFRKRVNGFSEVKTRFTISTFVYDLVHAQNSRCTIWTERKRTENRKSNFQFDLAGYPVT